MSAAAQGVCAWEGKAEPLLLSMLNSLVFLVSELCLV